MAIPLSTKVLSSTLIIVSTAIFGYYIYLLVILPFIDEKYALKNYFPDPYYVVALPLLAVVFALSAVCVFTGVFLIKATLMNVPEYQPVEGKDSENKHND